MNERNLDQRVTVDALIRELLGLDPSTLVAMDPCKRSAAAGLHVFMRRTLERALGTLWAPDTTVFRLRSDAAARALDWSNAAICNLSTLFAWTLSREPRRIRGQPDLPLLPADPLIIDLPQRYVAKANVSLGALVAMARDLFRTETGDVLRWRDIGEPQALSVSALIKETLGVTPQILVRSVHETPSDVDHAFARDPDGQAAAALAAWLMSLLDNYSAIIEQKIQIVGFIIADDSGDEEQGDARQANLMALLTAALLFDKRDVTFLAGDAA